MEKRLQLHAILCKILDCPELDDPELGKNCRAYFQPSPNTEMEYDCIVYERSRIDIEHADNRPYLLHDRYQVTVIYEDPDSDLPHKIAQLPMCAHERRFTADNLNHDVFNLYF